MTTNFLRKRKRKHHVHHIYCGVELPDRKTWLKALVVGYLTQNGIALLDDITRMFQQHTDNELAQKLLHDWPPHDYKPGLPMPYQLDELAEEIATLRNNESLLVELHIDEE